MRYARRINYVDAVQYTGDNIKEVADFMGVTEDALKPHNIPNTDDCDCIDFLTPNGVVMAFKGDWVCRDSSGKYYPCIDEVFRATYYVNGEGND